MVTVRRWVGWYVLKGGGKLMCFKKFLRSGTATVIEFGNVSAKFGGMWSQISYCLIRMKKSCPRFCCYA